MKTYESKLWIVCIIIAILFAVCIIGTSIQPLSAKYDNSGSGFDTARIAKFNVAASDLDKSNLTIAQGLNDSTKITVSNNETETASQYYVVVTFPAATDLPSDVTMNISYINSSGATKTVNYVKEEGKFVFRSDDWVFKPSSIETANQKELSLNFSLNSSKFRSDEFGDINEAINDINLCVYYNQID